MSVISREDAIAKIKDIPYVQEHPNIGLLFEEWLKSLPDADDGWIPCSERLPEDDTEVLVYLFDRPSPYIAWLTDCHWYTEDFEVEKENEPLAWMPLPKPYEPKEDK